MSHRYTHANNTNTPFIFMKTQSSSADRKKRKQGKRIGGGKGDRTEGDRIKRREGRRKRNKSFNFL